MLQSDPSDIGEGILEQVGHGSGIGMDPVERIVARYQHDDFLIRFRPRLELRDLDESMFMPVLSRSFAEKLQRIEVVANGYKLMHIEHEGFTIDTSSFKPDFSDAFTPDEVADPWVRIRPADFTSAFRLRFFSTTPARIVGHDETPLVVSGQARK